MTTDDALIAEARARASAEAPDWAERWTTIFTRHLIALVREDWRPEPEVDAVTLAAREWLKGYTSLAGAEHDNINAGLRDDHLGVRAFHAGHAHALANCADVRRMDWLERQPLTVTGFAGSTIDHRGYAVLVSLRTKIDRAMEGGE